MQHARRQEAGGQRVGEDALIAAAIYEELLIRLIWFAIPVLHSMVASAVSGVLSWLLRTAVRATGDNQTEADARTG
jgi:hypothetical protein